MSIIARKREKTSSTVLFSSLGALIERLQAVNFSLQEVVCVYESQCARPPCRTSSPFSCVDWCKNGTLTIRIYNYRAHSSASGEAFQVVNGCAAHSWGQVLMLEGQTCSLPMKIRILTQQAQA